MIRHLDFLANSQRFCFVVPVAARNRCFHSREKLQSADEVRQLLFYSFLLTLFRNVLNFTEMNRRDMAKRKFVPSGVSDSPPDYLLRIYNKLVSNTIFAANGCWWWMAARSKGGYGETGVFGIVQYTHILSYEMFVGPVPEGMELDHKCRNRACWNYSHLEPVTHVENMLRGESPYAKKKRQTHCKYGHPFAGDNLVFNPDGTRDCVICRRRRWRLNGRKKKQRALLQL